MKTINFTKFNSKDPLNKLFEADGKKTSRGQMYKGNAIKESVKSIEEFFKFLDELESNQAIALGTCGHDMISITTIARENAKAIARTKKNFQFSPAAYALLLIDYDPSENGYEVTSPEHLAEVLRDIDPELVNCDIGVRYGSSYGIQKDGVLISTKKSMHAYIAIDNATDEKVAAYREYLVAEAWEKGYGHIQLSSVGSVLRRQVFDDAVFSAERLIFEAAPTLAKGITRMPTKHYISEGK